MNGKIRSFIFCLSIVLQYILTPHASSCPEVQDQKSQDTFSSKQREVIFALYPFGRMSRLENEVPVGGWVTLLKNTFSSAQVPLKIVFVPTKRAVHLIYSGKADMILSMINHPMFLDDIAQFGSQKLIKLQVGIVSHFSQEGGPYDFIRNQRLGAIRGYSYDGVISRFSPKQLVPVNSHPQLFRMVKAKRLLFGLTYEEIFRQSKFYHASGLHFTQIQESHLYFGLSKLSSLDCSIILRLEKAYRQLLSKGELRDCCAQFIVTQDNE
ncbi:MAG: hypothetical protein D6160_20565 [Ketobacter sp.]|nr:MAG: hypothetical protein D6160_20565 [Ketobacter sp.]